MAEIVIRWRRYGRYGGRWRADFPPGNGIDSGWVESKSRDTVERFADVVAERYGYAIVEQQPITEKEKEDPSLSADREVRP